MNNLGVSETPLAATSFDELVEAKIAELKNKSVIVQERLLIGSVVLGGEDAIRDGHNTRLAYCKSIGLTEKSFVDPMNAAVFKSLRKLDEQGALTTKPTSIEVIAKDNPMLRGEDIAKHFDDYYSTGSYALANFMIGADKIRTYEKRRIGLQVAAELAKTFSTCYEGFTYVGDRPRMVEEAIAKAGQTLFEMQQTISVRQNTPEAIHESAERLCDLVERGAEAMTGVMTGYPDLDAKLFGLKKRELTILAARPSVGKTSLAMNIAVNVAKAQKRVLVISLEMSMDSLLDRMNVSEARLDVREAREGRMSEAKKELSNRNIKAAEQTLKELPLVIVDGISREIGEIRAVARREKHKEGGLDLIIVDYLQLMTSSECAKLNNRQLEVGNISGQLKQMAMELDCPVMALSQLSRVSEASGEAPKLSDLRDSGAIEQDADMVILMHKIEQSDAKAASQDAPLSINVKIAKNRNGPTGELTLKFNRQYTRFESW